MGIDVGSSVSATFSEAMNPLTLNMGTFKLNYGVSGSVTYDQGTHTATFKPSGSLVSNRTYTVTITTGVRDSAGNAMDTQYSWSFTTSASADTKPVVAEFTVPKVSRSSKIAVQKFTATDSAGVTGYMITETAVAPSGSVNRGWKSASPQAYVFKNRKAGMKTLYAWARNAAGKVSDAVSATVIFDNLPPKVPTGLKAIEDGSGSVSLTWNASADKPDADNSGVTGYLVFRNNRNIGSASDTNFTDNTALASTKYRYAVKAEDAAGNISAASKPVALRTSSSLNAGAAGFSGDVDVYVILYNFDLEPGYIHVLNPDNELESVEVKPPDGDDETYLFASAIAEYGLVPWKTFNAPVRKEDMKPDPEAAEYSVRILVTPKGNSDSRFFRRMTADR